MCALLWATRQRSRGRRSWCRSDDLADSEPSGVACPRGVEVTLPRPQPSGFPRQRLLRAGVEQVQAVRAHGEAHLLTAGYGCLGRQARAEHGAGGVEVDEQLVAEALDEVHAAAERRL